MAVYGSAKTAVDPNAGSLTGSSYGDLSKNDAFTIQKKMLPIAKRLLTFGKFAQKETKSQKTGLEIRHRRYERFPIVDQPLAEGVTPDFVQLQHVTIMHTLRQYGSYVNTTDVMMAAAQDPFLGIISERQAQQAGETLDFLAYKVFRAGTQVGYGASSAGRSNVNKTIANSAGILSGSPAVDQSTVLLDQAIRVLERADSEKQRGMIDATTGIDTKPIRPSYIGITHPDLRQDLEQIPGYVSVENYSDTSDVIDGEVGSARGIRFLVTTQATPFLAAGSSTLGQMLGTGSIDVYPVVIIAQDFGGCATLGGKDSLRSKVVLPKPGPGDPLGQRGTVAWDTFYSCVILQDLYMYRLEVACSKLS